jgi:putative oxygen-independent coproporphyrinogen III oxidase
MELLTAPPLSIYVHFPWCVRKCPYCDFNSHTLHGELPEERYVAALERDLESQARDLADREVISIFLGGGTPSLFSPAAIGRVLLAARKHFRMAADVEVTMEANPGAIERGRFAEYRSAGLNRVSLGAQSFNAQRLQALGRIHSPDETRRAAEELHAAGLENFNLDLMYALPGQDLAAAVDDVDAALALAPAHLSHYQLTLEPGTVFAAQRPELPTDDLAAEMLVLCGQRLAAAGFAQYEVSGYAKAQRQCRHNANYWLFGDYVGAGAGAHGKLTLPATGTVTRTVHAREPRRYLAAAGAVVTRRTVPRHELPFEFMMNGLRLVAGFEISSFVQRTGLAWCEVSQRVDALAKRGLVMIQAGRLRPTAQGLQFLNESLISFLPETSKTPDAFALSTAV